MTQTRSNTSDRLEMICHEVDKREAGIGGVIVLDDIKFLLAEIGRLSDLDDLLKHERDERRQERTRLIEENERLGLEVEELMKVDYWQDRYNILKSQASQWESTLTETMKERDALREKLDKQEWALDIGIRTIDTLRAKLTAAEKVMRRLYGKIPGDWLTLDEHDETRKAIAAYEKGEG